MRVALHVDNTLPLALDSMVQTLDAVCPTIEFTKGSGSVHIQDSVVSCPGSFARIRAQLGEDGRSDVSVVFTSIPYSNNFFYDEDGGLVVVSFSGWSILTDQPIENGAAYLIATMLADHMGFGEEHPRNRGCVNDFLWDKAGIDNAMRAASLCPSCSKDLREKRLDARSLDAVLDLVSRAARARRSVFDLQESEDSERLSVDVFICHNSDNRQEVRRLRHDLEAHGLQTWLDEADLEPGANWPEELEAVVTRARSALVCFGDQGLGRWQKLELQILISMSVDQRLEKLIPVILDSTTGDPTIPLILKAFQCVDMRGDRSVAVQRLVGALR